ncbi:MAG TPA: hypothetical protein VKE40_05845 [Gemmataceae bacterium]|nr:hypothetical protein [Gemmataceae bacterium]
MFRFIIAVVVGYLVMVVLVVATSSVAFVVPDVAFQKDSFDVTHGWLAYALAVGLVAAVAGGFVAARIARRRRAAAILAALALIIGLLSAVGNLRRERPTGSPAGLTTTERASRMVQPTWYAFTLPFVGAAGVLVGGRCARREW